MISPVKIYVYGAEVKCASCVNLPSAKETFEWLEAAISRKYTDRNFQYIYVDLHSPKDEEKEMAMYILKEELFYPVVVINNEIVAEGNPRLTSIYKKIDELI